MKYGFVLPRGDAQTAAEFAFQAEEAGWDGFFIWDHIARGKAPQNDPWVAMAAIACNTEKMRLGLMVTPLARRRPWKVNQLLPIVHAGLANNPSFALTMLNLSNLPVDASPEQCLAWVRLFTDSLDCGSDSATAVYVANKSVISKS